MNAETALSLVRADEAIIRFAALHESAIGTKRTFVFASHMSAFGTKRTSFLYCETSAYDPKRTWELNASFARITVQRSYVYVGDFRFNETDM